MLNLNRSEKEFESDMKICLLALYSKNVDYGLKHELLDALNGVLSDRSYVSYMADRVKNLDIHTCDNCGGVSLEVQGGLVSSTGRVYRKPAIICTRCKKIHVEFSSFEG